MLHVPFRHQSELLSNHTTFATAYAEFLQSGSIPQSLEDDIHRLQELSQRSDDEDTEVSLCTYTTLMHIIINSLLYTYLNSIIILLTQDDSDQQPNQRPTRAVEEWMLICQSNTDLQPSTDFQEDTDWSAGAQAYPNVEEMPTFISRHRESAGQQSFTTSADPQCLHGKQLQAYELVREHAESDHPPPLRLIVSGTVGTGKSYLIHFLQLFLDHRV